MLVTPTVEKAENRFFPSVLIPVSNNGSIRLHRKCNIEIMASKVIIQPVGTILAVDVKAGGNTEIPNRNNV